MNMPWALLMRQVTCSPPAPTVVSGHSLWLMCPVSRGAETNPGCFREVSCLPQFQSLETGTMGLATTLQPLGYQCQLPLSTLRFPLLASCPCPRGWERQRRGSLVGGPPQGPRPPDQDAQGAGSSPDTRLATALGSVTLYPCHPLSPGPDLPLETITGSVLPPAASAWSSQEQAGRATFRLPRGSSCLQALGFPAVRIPVGQRLLAPVLGPAGQARPRSPSPAWKEGARGQAGEREGGQAGASTVQEASCESPFSLDPTPKPAGELLGPSIWGSSTSRSSPLSPHSSLLFHPFPVPPAFPVSLLRPKHGCSGPLLALLWHFGVGPWLQLGIVAMDKSLLLCGPQFVHLSDGSVHPLGGGMSDIS